MKCPICNEEQNDNSMFCTNCGKELKTMNNEFNQVMETTKKRKSKKTFIVVGAIVGIIAAGVVTLLHQIKADAENKITPVVCATSNMYEFINDIEEGPIEFSSNNNGLNTDPNVKFSPDGKYIYFVNNYSIGEKSTCSLYCAQYELLRNNLQYNDEYVKLISVNAEPNYSVLDSGKLVYMDNDDNLNVFDGNESKLLADNVSTYMVDGSDRIVYIEKVEKYYNVWALGIDNVDKGAKKLLDNIILASNQMIDLDNMFFSIYKENDELETIFVGFNKEAKYIGEHAGILGEKDDKNYFVVRSEQGINPYNFVSDSMVEEDKKFTKEPLESDFAVPNYKYESVTDDIAVDNLELYTSLVHAGKNYKKYKIEELVSMWKSKGDFNDILDEFCYKYGNIETDDGYFPVTPEVKEYLIRLASEWEIELEDGWKLFCFYKTEDGTKVDYDSYYDAYHEYKTADYRNQWREYINDKEREIPLYDIKYVQDGKDYTVIEGVKAVQRHGDVLIYKTFSEKASDRSKCEKVIDVKDIDYMSEVYDLIEKNTEINTMALSLDSGEKFAISDEAYTFMQEHNKWGDAKLYSIDNYLYINTSENVLYVSDIKNGIAGQFQVLEDDVQTVGIYDNKLYYYGDFQSSERMYCNASLCYYEGNRNTVVLRDIIWNSVRIYEDGAMFAYSDAVKTSSDVVEYNDYGVTYTYTLKMISKDGKEKVISKGVSQFERTDTNGLLLISDGKLYVYNKKGKSRLEKEAKRFWCRDVLKPIKEMCSYSIY